MRGAFVCEPEEPGRRLLTCAEYRCTLRPVGTGDRQRPGRRSRTRRDVTSAPQIVGRRGRRNCGGSTGRDIGVFVRPRRCAHRIPPGCMPPRGRRCSTPTCVPVPNANTHRSSRSTRSRTTTPTSTASRARTAPESFLVARGIDLPEGHPGDRPGAQTVQGLGNRKNEIVLRRIRRDGVHAYSGSVAYVRAVRDAGLRRAVVSSSTNCRDVLCRGASRTCSNAHRWSDRAAGASWRANQHQTCSSPPHTPSGLSPAAPRCSKTPWPGSPPAERADSAT